MGNAFLVRAAGTEVRPRARRWPRTMAGVLLQLLRARAVPSAVGPAVQMTAPWRARATSPTYSPRHGLSVGRLISETLSQAAWTLSRALVALGLEIALDTIQGAGGCGV